MGRGGQARLLHQHGDRVGGGEGEAGRQEREAPGSRQPAVRPQRVRDRPGHVPARTPLPLAGDRLAGRRRGGLPGRRQGVPRALVRTEQRDPGRCRRHRHRAHEGVDRQVLRGNPGARDARGRGAPRSAARRDAPPLPRGQLRQSAAPHAVVAHGAALPSRRLCARRSLRAPHRRQVDPAPPGARRGGGADRARVDLPQRPGARGPVQLPDAGVPGDGSGRGAGRGGRRAAALRGGWDTGGRAAAGEGRDRDGLLPGTRERAGEGVRAGRLRHLRR